MAARFVTTNPALAPLFAAVGAGVVGAGWYGFHVLKNNQDVLIARTTNPTPWNNVRQDQNTKLYSPNADFWKSRTGLPDPRSAFAATTGAVHDVAVKASAKVQEVKERALGRQ
ncbi:NADH-ubiquinone reductase complex 1 MLRQ subunit-domain-containing protein [Rhizoctonia solani]|nr:NADH-ubiquinone reductase complex 1 MLRQ subunit-domain-containing protein [Rhizoctonia solani]